MPTYVIYTLRILYKTSMQYLPVLNMKIVYKTWVQYLPVLFKTVTKQIEFVHKSFVLYLPVHLIQTVKNTYNLQICLQCYASQHHKSSQSKIAWHFWIKLLFLFNIMLIPK